MQVLPRILPINELKNTANISKICKESVCDYHAQSHFTTAPRKMQEFIKIVLIFP